MAKLPTFAVGKTFFARSDTRSLWRVDKVLQDGLHVALVRVDEPSRRKTISVWALSDAQHFKPVESSGAE